jgi:hypothetical protein
MGPGFRIMSRKFSKELGRSLVVETLQTGAIVVGDEGVEAGIAFGMAETATMVGGAVLRHPGSRRSSETNHLRRDDDR